MDIHVVGCGSVQRGCIELWINYGYVIWIAMKLTPSYSRFKAPRLLVPILRYQEARYLESLQIRYAFMPYAICFTHASGRYIIPTHRLSLLCVRKCCHIVVKTSPNLHSYRSIAFLKSSYSFAPFTINGAISIINRDIAMRRFVRRIPVDYSWNQQHDTH